MSSAWLLRRGAAAAVSSACSCSCSVVVATSTASTLSLHRNRTIWNTRNSRSCSISARNTTTTRVPTTIASPLHLHCDWIPAVPAPAPSPDHSPTTTTTTSTTTTKNKNKNNDYTLLFLHGLLGQGRNLKTFARQLLRQEERCHGGILMDLRGHGQSYQTQKKRQQQPPPESTTATSTKTTTDAAAKTVSTFIECVDDIRFTLQEFHATATATPNPSTIAPTSVLVGHSFGGRLALEYAYDLVRRRRRYQQPPPLPPKSPAAASAVKTVWLLDTVPGEANASVEHVLDILTQVLKTETAPGMIEKKDMVALLTQPPYQLDIGTAQWLAMSYNGIDFGFDQEFVTRMKPEFATQDFLGMVRYILGQNITNTDHPPITIHLVRGGKNSGWTPPILADLDAVTHEYPTTFYVHVLPQAGHNVHVDDLPGLLHLFATHAGT